MASHETPATNAIRLHPRPKYLALTLASIQRAVAYRGTTFLNLLANLIWVAVLYYLWRTVFAGRATIGGFDWDEMRTYILVSYAVNALLSFYSMARMTSMIRTGEIATELIRPIDYLSMQLAQTFGAALIEGALSGVLAVLLGGLLLHIAPPHSPVAALLFLLSVWFGFLIKFLISFLVALLCFRTVNAVGLIWTQTAIINLFSGSLIPLAFFPDWLRTIGLAMPFQGIVYTPLTIYLGKVQGMALWGALTIQVFWVVVLWALARLLWNPSVRALDIQGG
jgi:ABC-2 type transport system permease protein